MSEPKPNLFLLSTHGTWGTTDGSKLDEIIQLFQTKAEEAYNACSRSSGTVYLGYDGDSIQSNNALKNVTGLNMKLFGFSFVECYELVPPTLYLLVMINKFLQELYTVKLVQCQNNYISCFSRIADYLDSDPGKIWVDRLELNSVRVKDILRSTSNVSNTFINNQKDTLLTCEGKEATNFADATTNLGEFHTEKYEGLVYGGITFDGTNLVGSTKCWKLYLDKNKDVFEEVHYVPAWNNDFTDKKDPYAGLNDSQLRGLTETELKNPGISITTMIKSAILKGMFTYNEKPINILEDGESSGVNKSPIGIAEAIRRLNVNVRGIKGGSRKRKNKTKRKKSKKKNKNN